MNDANSLTEPSLTPVRGRGRTRLGVVDHTARLEAGQSSDAALRPELRRRH